MAITLFSSLTEKDKNSAIDHLIEESTPNDSFFFMVVLSVLMATFGLLMNNAAVVIGSMLIAPILSPLLSFSLGIITADMRLIMRSLVTVAKALLFAIPAAAIATLLFGSQVDTVITSEVMLRTDTSTLAALVGLVAGLAASFALIRPKLSEALPGVAVSVALIPPIAVTGIGLAQLNFLVASRAFVLFLISSATIIFGSMLIFSLMNLYVKRGLAEKAVKREDAKLKREQRKAEKEARKK